MNERDPNAGRGPQYRRPEAGLGITEQDPIAALAAQVEALTAHVTGQMVTTAKRRIPGWAWWAIAGVLLVFTAIGFGVFWSTLFGGGGTTEAEAAAAATATAKQHEALHVKVKSFLIAFCLAVAATAVALYLLMFALDRMTVRREFLDKVKAGEADALSMAVFSIGTAIYCGLVFHAVFDAVAL